MRCRRLHRCPARWCTKFVNNHPAIDAKSGLFRKLYGGTDADANHDQIGGEPSPS